jgi:hypothetical protein
MDAQEHLAGLGTASDVGAAQLVGTLVGTEDTVQ